MNAVPARARLVDAADEPGRTTATLVASLAARLGTLYLVSGADAVGSLAAGFAALGREVARTSEGARLREALESGRVGVNGDTLWQTLQIGRWVSSLPPSPVLDQLRNDVALLLADDLGETLALMPIPGEPAGRRAEQPTESAFADLVLGLWAFSRELVAAVEACAAPTLRPPGALRAGEPPGAPPEGEILR
jgi:hypothetical protein